MKKNLIYFFLLIALCMAFITGCSKSETSQFAEPKKGETVAEIVVEGHGSIFVKFFDKEAPKAVKNFTQHSKDGYYDGLTFHRVIEDFMIQGGDPNGTGSGGESIWQEDFEDEFDSKLHPYRGALCMANRGPSTNGSQFFIVQSSETYEEDILKQLRVEFDEKAIKNYSEIGGTPWLYKAHTVFGQVYDGLDVVDKIVAVEKIDPKNGIPKDKVIIETIKVFEYKK